MQTSESLLTAPAVRDLIAQGARMGRVSYAQINDLLIDLELDEDDVETLLSALEKRAIAVVDEEVRLEETTPKATKNKSKAPQQHEDLDSILADLDAISTEDALESVGQFLAEEEEELYTGDDLDNEQTPVADALKIYLNRMGEIPRLSPEVERELARQARDGDEETARDAKNQLVEANLRLVVHLARSAAARTTLSITDLLQEGNLGLLDAVERYRPESNKTFGAYATWWVRRAMNRAINENSRMLRLTGELYTAIQKMQTAQRELTQKLGRSPSRAEIAEATGLSVEQIEEAQRAAAATVSLDQSSGAGDEQAELGEQLSDPEAEIVGDVAARNQARQSLEKMLEDLTEREQTIVSMRFGLGDYAEAGARSADDVAQTLKISRDRVQEIETRALRKLRRKAKSAGLDESFG